MEPWDTDPQICKPSCIDFTCIVVMHNWRVRIFLPPLPEDQAFQSLDLSLNQRSLTHPAYLCCCWAQGPILGTLVGIYSATQQQGPQVAASKAVIKSLLWVLWAGACLPESCLSQNGFPYLSVHISTLMDILQARLLSFTSPPSACHPYPSTPLAGSSSLSTSARVTSESASVEKSGEIDASMFPCYPEKFWNVLEVSAKSLSSQGF